MTEKLYWQNPYLTEFQAKILSIISNNTLILDKTLFYPESGGQMNDLGIIVINDQEFKVKNVFEKNGQILHRMCSDLPKHIKTGNIIKGKINWERRYALMRAHSSQHLFSAFILKNFNIHTTRAKLKIDEVSISFSKEITYDQLSQVIKELNSIFLHKSIRISSKIISQKEAKKIKGNIRSEIPDKSEIRLMVSKNYDMVCCGGTHVKNSTEIGPLFIYQFNSDKLKYYVGKKASNSLSNTNKNLLEIMEALNQPIDTVKNYIYKLQVNVKALQDKNSDLAEKNLELLIKNPSEIIKEINIYLTDIEYDYKIIKNKFETYPEKSIFLNNIGNKIIFLSNLSDISANSLFQHFIKKFGGKGGGSNYFAQGILEKKPKSFVDEIRNYIESQ